MLASLSRPHVWRFALIAVFFLGVLNGAFWIHHKSERWYAGEDSEEYHLLATNLLDGHGFSREKTAPFTPTAFREPGYPVFVAAVLDVSQRSDQVVAVAQALLLGTSALLTALLGRAVFRSPLIALLGAVSVAFSPDLGDQARYEMSEALFVPVLLLAVLLSFYAWQRRTTRQGIVAGIASAAAGYVRVAAFPVMILFVLGTLLLDRFHHRPRWGWAPALGATMILLALPWVARNAIQVGQVTFTGRSGGFIIPRADKAQLPVDQQISLYETAVWAVTFPVSALIVPTSHLYTPPYIWDGPLGELELRSTTHAFGAYCQNIDDVAASDACQMRVGTALILSHPLGYVYMTPLEFFRLSFYIYPSKLSVIHNGTVWLGLFTLLACVISAPRRTPEHLWLAIFIAAYTLFSIAGDTQPRYGVPLLPYYGLFAAAGVVWVGEWARGLLPTRFRPAAAPAGAS